MCIDRGLTTHAQVIVLADEPTTSSSGATEDQARLTAVLSNAVDGIITIDNRGLIEQANPAAERLFGYDLNEMVGQNVRMLMPAPYRDEHDGYIANYLKTGDAKIIGVGREVEGRRKDGSTFPMYLSVSEVRLGSRILFTGIVHNLVELKQAEQAATQLGRVLEDSRNEIYIFDAETLRFVLVNRGARENVGYSMDELTQMTPVELKPEFDKRAFSELTDALLSGETDKVNFETVHRRKDGTTYPVDVHMQVSEVAEQALFVAIILDVTERKQAEAEREKLQRQLEGRLQELKIRDQAIQSAGEGIIIADATQTEHPIIFVNAAFEAMTGYSADDIVGRTCCLLHEGDEDQPGVNLIRTALADGRPCHAVVRNYRRDGSMFWNDISLAPVLDANGEPTHIVAVMEDVTERRRLQKERVQTERLAAIGEMVTGLAHESRNALQRAQACLDMLSLDLEEQPEQLDLTTRARVAIDDLRRLYEEVRNYAAPFTLEKRECCVPDLWRKVWDDLSILRNERDVTLDESVEDPTITADIDAHRVEQVVRNIFENALAACSDPCRIEIECAEVELGERAAVRVCFRDNGPGFERDVATKVFQPFFTTKQKGTGLGMAIAKRIIDAHGGHIEVGRPGSGAEIVVTLPR